MTNYDNSKIYKMTSGELVYYGSTVKTLAARKANHKYEYKIWLEGKKRWSMSSFQLYETGLPIDIVLVEKYPCIDKEELHQRERYYIENNECVNLSIPIISKEERKEKRKGYHKNDHIKHKEERNEKRNIYHHENKEKINANKREKYTCGCGALINKSSKYQHEKTNRHLLWMSN